MGECEFCSCSMFGNGHDITKRLGARMISMPGVDKCSDIYRLEAWLLRDDLEQDKAKLYIDVTEYGKGSEFTSIDIPVKFCPRCGRKL